MAMVIISYRQEDTADIAKRLHTFLAASLSDVRLGAQSLIQPGKDVQASIEEALKGCTALVIVIGNQWAAGGWLTTPADPEQMLLAAALGKNLHVIPVLVEGAALPKENLPENLTRLASLPAIPLRFDSFANDAQQIVTRMGESDVATLRLPSTSPAQPAQATKQGSWEASIPEIVRMVISNGLALIFLIAVVLFFSSNNAVFTSTRNLTNLLTSISVWGPIAIAMTFLIAQKHIDLSVAGIVGVTSVAAVAAANNGTGLAAIVIIGLGIGLGVGLLQGTIIVALRIPSAIVTLMSLYLFRYMNIAATGGRTLIDNQRVLQPLSTRSAMGITNIFFVFLAIAILALILQILWLVVRQLLQEQRASQSQAQSPTLKVVLKAIGVILLFGFSGMIAGLSGVLLAGYISAATPVAGTGYEVLVIGAVVLGGASLVKGNGWVLGTVIGILILGALQNGMQIMNAASDTQFVVITVLIIVVAIISRLVEMVINLIGRLSKKSPQRQVPADSDLVADPIR